MEKKLGLPIYIQLPIHDAEYNGLYIFNDPLFLI